MSNDTSELSRNSDDSSKSKEEEWEEKNSQGREQDINSDETSSKSEEKDQEMSVKSLTNTEVKIDRSKDTDSLSEMGRSAGASKLSEATRKRQNKNTKPGRTRKMSYSATRSRGSVKTRRKSGRIAE